MSLHNMIRPWRLRRRLAVAILMVGALSAGAVAVSGYLLVRQARLHDSADAAVGVARVDLGLAERTPNGAVLISELSTRGQLFTLAEGGQLRGSALRVPVGLQRLVRGRRQIAYQRMTVRGEPLVVVGVPQPRLDRQLYLFSSEAQLWRDLGTLRNVLLIGWLVVTGLSGVAGIVLARGLLRPVAAASNAARSLAEGLLDTRLPAGAEDEFGVWAASFNSMADALQAKITELTAARERERRFTADVAHELRTPLTALVNEVRRLSLGIDRMPPNDARMIELLGRDSGRLRRLIDDLLEISRLEAGQEPIERDRVDVAKLIDTIVQTNAWNDHVTVAANGTTLVTDRHRLERILSNLIGNAIEHGGRSTRVAAHGSDEGVLIDVSDQGPGIPPEFMPHLFERFSKADTSRSANGSGLGLAIAAENAALLAGRIEVTNLPGRGARFTLHLPGGHES